MTADGSKRAPPKDPTKVVAIRMHASLNSELELILAESKIFNSKPEFVMFALRDAFMNSVGSLEIDGSDGGIEPCRLLREEILLNKTLFDRKMGDFTQIAIRVPLPLYMNLSLVSTFLQVKLQDFVKYSIMTGIKRLENTNLEIKLNIGGND